MESHVSGSYENGKDDSAQSMHSSGSTGNDSVVLEKIPTAPAAVYSQSEMDPELALAVTNGSRPPITRVVTAQDWTGPDDPENPFNWPMWKRWYTTSMTGLLSFAVTFASPAYTPGYPEVAQQFGVSGTAALLGFTLYVIGLGAGPMLAAPISETYGRNIVYRVSMLLFMLFTLGAGWSQTFAQLLVCRFFAGICGSPVLAVGSGTNADLWPAERRAIAGSTYLMMPFLGAALGPVAAGFSAMNKGWRWTQWDILFVSLAAYLISLPSQETYKKIILQRRAKRLGLEPPKSGLKGWQMAKVFITLTIARPVRMLVSEPIVLFLSVYTAFSFAVLYAFLAAYPIVFEGVYGFNQGETGLAFLGIAAGVLLGVGTGIFAQKTIYAPKHRAAVAAGTPPLAGMPGLLVPPEHRLYPAMVGCLGLPIGLFWLGWTSRASVHWISPVLAGVPFAWGNICIFISTALYLIDTYGPRSGASAIAANGFLRYTLAAAFPLFTVQMFHGLGVGWATSVFGFISILLMPIPWVLFRWGPRIRAKSSYVQPAH